MGQINRVAVLGSGVMGSAIAAHLANCGVPSIMLDIVPPDLPKTAPAAQRNSIAAKAKDALFKAKPAPLYRKDLAGLIEVGNLDDDLARIAECDWIIEVVKEDLKIKRSLYERVAKHRKPGAIVSSNTSGVPLHSMVDVMDDDMRKHFVGTHFFNPPRYLKLLEIIPGPDTLPEVIETMADFGENVLGKGIVYAKDTPNFIANRILTFGSQYINYHFRDYELSVEDVDNLTGPIVGHASSATFRTADLVGLDTYVHVVGNVFEGCPDDERRDYFQGPDWLEKMVEKGLIGQKSGAGFYKKTNERDETGKPVILSLDIDSFEYTPQDKQKFPCIGAAKAAGSLEERVKVMHTGDDPGSQFVWKVFSNTAHYAAMRIPEVADDIVNIDNACKWGFAWEIGLFEVWDVLGFDYVCSRMKEDGLDLPPIAKAMQNSGVNSFYRLQNGVKEYFDMASKSYVPVPANPNQIVLAAVKDARGIVKKNEACSLIDLGDGILCAEFHTKMNTIDANMAQMLNTAVEMLNEGQFEGMVLGNQGDHFSAGANLFLILGQVMQGDWAGVEEAVRGFHGVNMAMRFCKRPIVSTPHHYTFGGGIEMCQHTTCSVIAGETYGGLVEVGVGLIPGGGGTKEMLRRALAYVPANVPDGDPFPYVRRAFETIALAKVSTSGAELIELGYLAGDSRVVVNFDHQIKKAKDVCRGLIVAGYEPPQPASLTVLGEPARAVFRSGIYQMRLGGYASEHDAFIAEQMMNVLTGGDRVPGTKMTEQDALDLEREAMLTLLGTEKTQQRMQHMLQTGKPLRN